MAERLARSSRRLHAGSWAARPTLDCRECETLAPIAVGGLLTSAEQDRFDAHLADCAACRRRVEALRRAAAEPDAGMEEPLSDETRDRLLDVFRSWHRRRCDD